MIASKAVTLAVSALLLLSTAAQTSAGNTFTAADAQDVRALFLRQAAGETVHDLAAIDGVLAHAAPGQPDPVTFIARAYRFWGREAVMDHFRTTFAATWKFEPDQDAIQRTRRSRSSSRYFCPMGAWVGPRISPTLRDSSRAISRRSSAASNFWSAVRSRLTPNLSLPRRVRGNSDVSLPLQLTLFVRHQSHKPTVAPC